MSSSNISESVRLLGMMVRTVPFNYEDKKVTCSYESYVDIEDLKLIRKDLQAQLDKGETITDVYRISLQDDIYFIDTVIQTLESKIN